MPDGQQNTHYNINKLNSIVFRKNRRPAETTGVGWESWQSNPENGRLRGVWWWRQEWPRERNGGSEEETKEENCDWLKLTNHKDILSPKPLNRSNLFFGVLSSLYKRIVILWCKWLYLLWLSKKLYRNLISFLGVGDFFLYKGCN